MTEPVTRTASKLKLLNDGAAGLSEVRDVVVLEQVGAPAVEAHSVSFFHDPLLSRCRMTLPRRSVDRTALGVVDESADKRVVEHFGYCCMGDRCAVVESCSIAPHMENDFGDHLSATRDKEANQPIGSLLGERRPNVWVPRDPGVTHHFSVHQRHQHSGLGRR